MNDGHGLWRNDPATPGGKYLVSWFDGAPPIEPPYMLWGACDPAAPAGLRAYAAETVARGALEALGVWAGPVPPAGELPAVSPSQGNPYFVRRRDDSVPIWPWEVLVATDGAAPAALRAYADEADRLGFDAAYGAQVRALAAEFEVYRAGWLDELREGGEPSTREWTAADQAGLDADVAAYAAEVRAAADAFDAYRAVHGAGVPFAPPERPDDAAVAARLARGPGA